MLGTIYVLHHLSFLARVLLDLGAVDPLPMLNVPAAEALNVPVELDAPKLIDGVVDGAVKLNPALVLEAPN